MAEPTKPLDSAIAKAFAKTASGVPKGNAAIKVRRYSDPGVQYAKLLFYGPTGSGKTLMIGHLLECGETVLVISTDFGGSGLDTVVNYLRAAGKESLLANLYEFELPTYEDCELFVKEPTRLMPAIYDADISVLFWDGFSGFQNIQLDEYVLGLAAAGKDTPELREAGLFANQQDWGGIKRGTTTNLNRFLRLHNVKTGKLWHKVVTALEDDKAQEYGASGDSKRKGPLVQGSAKKLIEPAFNLIGRCVRTTDGKYQYHFGGDDRTVAKQRGYGLSSVEAADMKVLWPKIVKPGVTK